jgi:hypothetical protein
MKKQILLLMGLFAFNLLFAQETVLKIIHLKSEREMVIEENDKIIVKTKDGRKIRGPYTVEGDSTISIKGELISLADIAELKPVNIWVPLVVLGGAIMVVGTGMVLFGIAAGVFLTASKFLWVIPGSLCIGTGAVLPGLLGVYKSGGKWGFAIAQTSP